MKSIQINNYFYLERPSEPEKKGLYYIAIIMFGISFLLLIGMLIGFLSFPLIPFGIVAILAGIYFLKEWNKPYLAQLARYESRPTDQEMDNWLLEDLQSIVKARAFERFDIDKKRLDDERYLILPTPLYWKVPGYFGRIYRKRGNDGAYRYTSWSVDVLILTKNYVSVFGCVFDWLSGSVTYEETNEFFYNDISSIKTGYEEFEKSMFDNEESKIGEIFKLKIVNASGDVMALFSDIPKLAAPGATRMKIESVVSKLRLMLRNRRNEEDTEFDLKPEKNIDKGSDNEVNE
jgi:hypothetical protein